MEYPYVKGVSEKFGITSITKQTDIPRVSYIDYDLFYIYLADAMSTIPSMTDRLSMTMNCKYCDVPSEFSFFPYSRST